MQGDDRCKSIVHWKEGWFVSTGKSSDNEALIQTKGTAVQYKGRYQMITPVDIQISPTHPDPDYEKMDKFYNWM